MGAICKNIIYAKMFIFFHCLHKIIHYLLNNECYGLNNQLIVCQ